MTAASLGFVNANIYDFIPVLDPLFEPLLIVFPNSATPRNAFLITRHLRTVFSTYVFRLLRNPFHRLTEDNFFRLVSSVLNRPLRYRLKCLVLNFAPRID